MWKSCYSWGHFTGFSFVCNSNSVEILLYCYLVTGHLIATICSTCHDSTIVMSCAKFDSNHLVRLQMREQNAVSIKFELPWKKVSRLGLGSILLASKCWLMISFISWNIPEFCIRITCRGWYQTYLHDTTIFTMPLITIMYSTVMYNLQHSRISLVWSINQSVVLHACSDIACIQLGSCR